jgi:hypothetical protein
VIVFTLQAVIDEGPLTARVVTGLYFQETLAAAPGLTLTETDEPDE